MITKKTPKEIEIMAKGGKILALVLTELKNMAKPSLNLLDLEEKTKELLKKYQVSSSFLGFRGYPANICLSVNEQVVHCIPVNYILKEGDILSIDLGIKYQGFMTDSAFTVPIGRVSKEAWDLIKVTKKALEVSLKEVKIGNKIGDISFAIQKTVEDNGLKAVEGLTGHGIGRSLQEDPPIPNVGAKGTGVLLEEGMVLAIEPIVTLGEGKLNFKDDHWTTETADHKPAAHFEHTVAITKNGPKVLTQS